jgi:hypothetical protein
MKNRFSTKKAVWLAALAIGLSAAIVAPALGVQNSFISISSNTSVSKDTSPKDVDESLTRPAGTVDPSPLNQSVPSDTDKTPTTPSPAPVVKPTPTPLATSTPAPVAIAAPAPQEVKAPAPTPSPTPTPAPVVQQPPTAPVVGTVGVSQILPGNGTGEAVLQWSSIPSATEYRIYKTGTIRPSWRLFYVYPPSITSITIFDQPGSIAIYKIMPVINSKEVFMGEAIYEPTN